MVTIKTFDAPAELWDSLARLAKMMTSIELNTLFRAESGNGAPQTQTFDHIQDAKRDMYDLNAIDEIMAKLIYLEKTDFWNRSRRLCATPLESSLYNHTDGIRARLPNIYGRPATEYLRGAPPNQFEMLTDFYIDYPECFRLLFGHRPIESNNKGM